MRQSGLQASERTNRDAYYTYLQWSKVTSDIVVNTIASETPIPPPMIKASPARDNVVPEMDGTPHAKIVDNNWKIRIPIRLKPSTHIRPALSAMMA